MKRLFSVTLLIVSAIVFTRPAAAESNAHHFWSVYSGQWDSAVGHLSNDAWWGDSWIWAGQSPITTQGDIQAELNVAFASIPGDYVGRHGGIMFYASAPTDRWDSSNSGYVIDWIDRPEDHGFRLRRWDNGYEVFLVDDTLDLAEPPRFWQLQVEGDVIRFCADGQVVFEFVDGTYREGHFGVWAYGNGTQILVDDVRIGNNFRDSFNSPILTRPVPPPPPVLPPALHFWSIYSGQWDIVTGQLSNAAWWGDSWIWAGPSPMSTQGDMQAELNVAFANIPGDYVGRHGGIMFYASAPTDRWDPANSGYVIDWIDRPEDHGFRLRRWDHGYEVFLADDTLDLAEPPRFWRLQVEGDEIRFYADGQLVFEFVDGTYREGHFGVWAYGNGTQILVDDVRIGNNF